MSRRAGSTAGAVSVLVVLFFMLSVPVVLSGRGGTSEAGDQARYHLPTIMTFSETWPHVDLHDYQSATSPGHHLLLAVLARYVTSDTTVLQLLHGLASLAVLLVVYVPCRWLVGPWRAVLLVLPLLLSSYFLGGAIWITTDNPALLWVSVAIAVSVFAPTTAGTVLGAGVASLAAVWIRQLHLWTAGVVGLAGALASPLAAFAPAAVRPVTRGRWTTLAAAVVGVALPFGLMAWLYWMWGGLTPPAYRYYHAVGANTATPAIVLSLVGCFGVFFVSLAWPQVRALRVRDPWLIGVVVVAAAACLVPPTAFSQGEAGRWGGAIWVLVRETPAVADRSLVLLPLAVTGAIVLLVLQRAAQAAGRTREAWLILAAGGMWLAAQTLDTQCFQRYLEPLILILLSWLAAVGAGTSSRRSSWAGPATLAAVQLGLVVYTFLVPVFGAVDS